jgi:biopolymer transport protein TolQ
MNTDLSIFHLVTEASFVVQFVMLILFVASLVSWTFIFSKRKDLNRAIEITDEFEEQFWSGVSLSELYRKLAAKDFEPEGIEKIFLNYCVNLIALMNIWHF